MPFSIPGILLDAAWKASPIYNGYNALTNLGKTGIDLAAGDIDGAREHSVDALISGVKMIPGIGTGVTVGEYAAEAVSDDTLEDKLNHDIYGPTYQPASLQQPMSDEERALAQDEGRRYDDPRYDMMRRLGVSPEVAGQYADLRAQQEAAESGSTPAEEPQYCE